MTDLKDTGLYLVGKKGRDSIDFCNWNTGVIRILNIDLKEGV
jgi:hypothetical protein